MNSTKEIIARTPRVNMLCKQTKLNVIDAMDEYAKQEAIGFNEFLKDNSYTKGNKGWYQYFQTVEELPKGVTMSFPVYEFTTIEAIYELYIKSKQPKV